MASKLIETSTNKHDMHQNAIHDTSLESYRDNFTEKVYNSTPINLNVAYENSTRENHKNARPILYYSWIIAKRLVAIFFYTSVCALITFALLSLSTNSLYNTTINYNEEVKFIINLNNDTVEKTIYEHISINTSNMYIEQQGYEYEITSLKKKSGSNKENTDTIDSAQVNGKYIN